MKIEREIINQFKEWKKAEKRKPILLKGARQIGKTWAMEQFGSECFEYTAKFDFDRQQELKSVFATSKEPERIIKELSLYSDVPLVSGKTLLIFDEIQECEEALNSLKYFCEDAPEWHIIAAGSLLGVAVKRRRMTVPVGKVQMMRMYPVSFREFLHSCDPSTYEYLAAIDSPQNLPLIIMDKLKSEYRRYIGDTWCAEECRKLSSPYWKTKVCSRWMLFCKEYLICTNWTLPNMQSHVRFHASMLYGTLCLRSWLRKTVSLSIKW